jgi:hypothetical protein|tara:strand:+ start:437 stop:538 length:102 start_codon:yes stop_codon:yes gene_type:complete
MTKVDLASLIGFVLGAVAGSSITVGALMLLAWW